MIGLPMHGPEWTSGIQQRDRKRQPLASAYWKCSPGNNPLCVRFLAGIRVGGDRARGMSGGM